MRRGHIFIIIVLMGSMMKGLFMPALAAAYRTLGDLTALSIEELMNIEVTSVSKRAQPLSDTASAIFVITQEDIRRSGVTSIPEALRMAPGLEVARIDANKWAITARGFNGRFANKLLVLIDGRTVYTPLFSGVFWDEQDTFLENIERIEVIRGPGASLWGANAVNGVINIITKKAGETTGGLFSAGGGTEERYFGGVRYGWDLGNNAYLRVYGKHFNRSGFVDAQGQDAADGWYQSRAGFKLDWEKSERDSFTVQGETYKGKSGFTLFVPISEPPYSTSFSEKADLSGGHLLARWRHVHSDTSDMTLQAYYDRSKGTDSTLEERQDTIDVDFQHHLLVHERHEIIWGLGYRYYRDHTQGGSFVSIEPPDKGLHLFSAFIQDEITLVKDRLMLTVGSKFEHNDFTGFEVQPTARILWSPHEKQRVWAAVSRAVRTPSRSDEGAVAQSLALPPNSGLNPAPFPVFVEFRGSNDFESETLIAYEAGYRVQPGNGLSVDLAVFYNKYDKLRTTDNPVASVRLSPPPPRVNVSVTADNKAKGETYGAEFAVDWQVFPWWRLKASYTYLQMQIHRIEGSSDVGAEAAEGDDPHNQFSLRSLMDLGRNVEFDAWFRYVDNLPSLGIRSYVTCDARIAWRSLKNVEIALVGQNLLDNHHPEQGLDTLLSNQSTEVPRGVYGKITWKF